MVITMVNPIIINLYDFDGTITKNGMFGADTLIYFIMYCYGNVKELRTNIRKCVLKGLSVYLKTKSVSKFKENSLGFLKIIEETPGLDLAKIVADFGIEHKKRVFDYFENSIDKDAISIIISATPEFLLESFAKEYGMGLIGTKIAPITGELLGDNCRKEEKIIRLAEYLKKHYPNVDFVINKVYSDTIIKRKWFKFVPGNDAYIGLLGKEAINVSSRGKLSLINTTGIKPKHENVYVEPGIKGLRLEMDKKS